MRGLVAAALAVLALLSAACGSDPRAPSAAEQVPALAVALERVDAALASQRFAAARRQLGAMRSAVEKAQEAGDLRDSDARRVLDAIARLLGTIPSAPSRAPDSTTPPPMSSSSAPPSEPATKSPGKTSTPVSTPPVPSDPATPSTTPSTTSPAPSGTPSDTPTSSPTGQSTTGEASPRPTSAATPTS